MARPKGVKAHDVRESYKRHGNMEAVARELGINTGTVSYHLKGSGLVPRKPWSPSTEGDELIDALKEHGLI